MWPLEDLMRFNPISPASWFDWALSDEALFHALLYTTSTYAGLIAGSTESKEAILHKGKSMSLVNRRLSQLGTLGFEEDEPRIAEGIIGAVSCLAITEVRLPSGKYMLLGLTRIGIEREFGEMASPHDGS